MVTGNFSCIIPVWVLTHAPAGLTMGLGEPNSNSNSTFIVLNLCQKTDSKAHHTKTLFNIQKPETLQGSAPRRKQKEIGNLGWVCFSKEV